MQQRSRLSASGGRWGGESGVSERRGTPEYYKVPPIPEVLRAKLCVGMAAVREGFLRLGAF